MAVKWEIWDKQAEDPGDNVGLIEAVNINITNMMDVTHFPRFYRD